MDDRRQIIAIGGFSAGAVCWFTQALLLLPLGVALLSSTALANDGAPIVTESKFELFVSDPTESTEFYSVLGFTVAHAQPYGYTTLRSGSTVIALSPHSRWLPVHWLGFLRYPPLGTEIVLYTAQLEEARSSLIQAGYSPSEIVLQSWGNRDFRITDPDGYYIRISEGAAVPQLP